MALDYNLGEMKSTSGAALRYEVEELASDLAIKLSQIIQGYPVYRDVAEKLKSSKTLLYFQNVIKLEIYPLIRDLCVIRWYQRNNKSLLPHQATIVAPNYGIYLLLSQVWPDQTIALQLDKQIFSGAGLSCRRLLKKIAKQLMTWRDKLNRFSGFAEIKTGPPKIALQYIDGVDLDRRSDIEWFSQSKIDPSRILVYFDGPDNITGKPVTEAVLATIEKLGMKWISLKNNSLARKQSPTWVPASNSPKISRLMRSKDQGSVEKWIMKKSKELFDKVDYWSSFYMEFNIKIHFIVEEGSWEKIAQSIAFDVNGKNNGLSVSRQRSEMFLPSKLLLGYHAKDVFFIWNKRYSDYLKSNYDQIKSNIVVGYPYDFTFNAKLQGAGKIRKALKLGADGFVVALFDNGHSRELHFSTEMMVKFYSEFLNWVIEDKTVGLLIKSKKTSVLDSLPQIRPILAQAEATGRCLCLDNEFGRLPIDASASSDLVVGIGISSAVIESIIAGRRSLHCDLTCLRSHEYYQWGYERIIFDNLERMMQAIKTYKANKALNPNLGDWSPFLDRLDAFRDGRAGERMGIYLRWCLEGFSRGLNRAEVLKEANVKYITEWGRDKVIENACSV